VDFALSDEQKDFVDAIRNFCNRECGTQDQRERLTDGYREHHNFDVYKQMAELGWLGVTIPEEYGGSGGSMLDACLFMEETSRGLAPIGGYATTLIVAGATQRFGTEAQKEEILGGIASGSVEAIAMTEPEAGSDVGALSCKAEAVDGGFVINGQKVFCSNAHISDHVLVVCRTDNSGSKHEGISHEDLIRMPHAAFFRRKGEPAFTMVGTRGEVYTDVESYLRHLKTALPEPYLHSRDMKLYLETLRDVVAGRVTVDQAIRTMPKLKRVGGMCPCSKSVRWVVEEGAEATSAS